MPMYDDEVGRDLKANELKVRTVVVIRREDRPESAMTLWVREIGQDHVVFWSGTLKITLWTYLREDGELMDETGKKIMVSEFLGDTAYGA